MGFSMTANVKGTIEERRLLLSPGGLLAGSDALYLQFKPIKGCPMLDKEYGKCFSILSQNFSNKIFDNGNVIRSYLLIFRYFLCFAIFIFSIHFNF